MDKIDHLLALKIDSISSKFSRAWSELSINLYSAYIYYCSSHMHSYINSKKKKNQSKMNASYSQSVSESVSMCVCVFNKRLWMTVNEELEFIWFDQFTVRNKLLLHYNLLCSNCTHFADLGTWWWNYYFMRWDNNAIRRKKEKQKKN